MGPIQGLRGGQLVDLGGPTQRRLVAALAARPDEVVSVTSLLTDLWGDDPPPSGPASIQSYVSRLRRNLGSGAIETKAPGYKLGADVVVDWVSFIEAAGRLPLDNTERLGTIDDALSLWRGPPFEDFDHVDFAARRLYDARWDLEEEKARLLAAAGQPSQAMAVLEKVTNAEPLRETAWTTLALILADAGRQAEALRALERYREKLADIGLEPGPSFAAAETEVFEAKPRVAPRPKLAKADTTFIGRSEEFAELTRLVAEQRLVTIVGPGGMGKTRLAMELARAWEETDVVMARLDSLRDDREVAPAVLNALGGETRGEITDSIIAHLARSEPTMLILDNVEHVIEAGASLVASVLSATETRVLVTSREPLNTPGETVLTLGPLDSSSAIELFRDRARRVDPDFEAASATLDMLCEELDYMPLAIEMAAARSKALAPEEILTRINRRYGLLDRPLRGGAERHRSLDALVDWSYGLLDDTGKRVFERLSVIAGTFDVELATALTGFGQVASEDVAAALANLVEKSLVHRTGAGPFRMLRVLKSFAGRQLAGSEDESVARTRHASWFAGLARQIGNGLSTPDEMWWIARANAAVDDIGDALRWSTKNGDLDSAQAILEGLFDWFYHRQPPSIVDWGDLVLPLADGHEALAVASAWSALRALKEGDADRAREIVGSGTSIEGSTARFAWFMAGEVACHEDRLDDALDAYRRQLVRASNMNDRIGVIDATAGEILALSFRGEFTRALDIAGNLEKMAADIGAPTYRAYADYTLGEAVIDSELRRSADLLESAALQAASVNNHYIQAMAKTTLGSVYSRLGRLDEAAETLLDALELWETMGMSAQEWTIVQFMGGVLAEKGDVETAARLLGAARGAGRRAFGAGQKNWAEVVAELESDPVWAELTSDGERMDLAQAVALVLSSPTRLRR